MFSRADVKEIFNRFVLLKLYADNEGIPEFQKKHFGGEGPPQYVIIEPRDDRPEKFATVDIYKSEGGAIRDVEDFKRFLSGALEKRGGTTAQARQ